MEWDVGILAGGISIQCTHAASYLLSDSVMCERSELSQMYMALQTWKKSVFLQWDEAGLKFSNGCLFKLLSMMALMNTFYINHCYPFCVNKLLFRPFYLQVRNVKPSAKLHISLLWKYTDTYFSWSICLCLPESKSMSIVLESNSLVKAVQTYNWLGKQSSERIYHYCYTYSCLRCGYVWDKCRQQDLT